MLLQSVRYSRPMNHDITTFTKSDMECINAYRILIQVTYLSEISNDQGNMLLQEAIKGTVDTNGKPLLWNISSSAISWPRQPRPATASWNKWKKYLQQITHPTLHIHPPLGNWTSTAHKHRKWYYTRQDNIIYKTLDAENTAYIETNSRTRTKTYVRTTHQLLLQCNTFIPTIPQHVTVDKLTCTNTQHTIVEDPQPQPQQPTLTFQTVILNNAILRQTALSQPEQTLTIAYELATSNRKQKTHALIVVNDTPVAITTFQIPGHRHNTALTHHAYGCVIPLLWCTSELIRQCSNYNVKLLCKKTQLHNCLLKTKQTDTSQ
jgi:hypothetical protein